MGSKCIKVWNGMKLSKWWLSLTIIISFLFYFTFCKLFFTQTIDMMLDIERTLYMLLWKNSSIKKDLWFWKANLLPSTKSSLQEKTPKTWTWRCGSRIINFTFYTHNYIFTSGICQQRRNTKKQRRDCTGLKLPKEEKPN